MSLLMRTQTSCASPCPIFAKAKIARNHGAFLWFADFLLTTKWYAPINKSLRAYSAFADGEKSVKRSHASRFRRMFVSDEQTSRRGEARTFGFIATLTKPINPARIFDSFCLFFFQKEKEDEERLCQEKEKLSPLFSYFFSNHVIL